MNLSFEMMCLVGLVLEIQILQQHPEQHTVNQTSYRVVWLVCSRGLWVQVKLFLMLDSGHHDAESWFEGVLIV